MTVWQSNDKKNHKGAQNQEWESHVSTVKPYSS